MNDAPHIRRRAVVAAAVVGLVVASAGCSTGPFRELWQRFGLAQPSVTHLDPAAIRASVKLPLPVRPKPEGAVLSLGLGPPGAGTEPANRRFPMVLVNEGRTLRAEGLPSAQPGYNWYLFKLTPAAERDLARVQAELAETQGQALEAAGVAVRNQYRNAVPGQALSRSVWLQLSRDDGFFPLERSETVTIGEDGEALR